MNIERLRELLRRVQEGGCSPEEALERLRVLPYEDLGFARLDHHRLLRQGFPEVIFCQGKTTAQIVEIVSRILEAHGEVLATRANREVYQAVAGVCPQAEYHEQAKVITIKHPERLPGSHDRELTKGEILVISAGTADIPIAEEATLTAQMLGSRVSCLYDVGVAGLHRLLGEGSKLREARVIVVVAGMEGALPSVVGGLVDKPIIAVPTSVGYGSSFGGLAPLLTMLNSCAAGVGVVNIDNGFGAGCLAHRINLLGETAARR